MAAKKAGAGKSPATEIGRASEQIASRLRGLGVALNGTETPDELADLHDAVERFEEAVEAKGGDLMVDEGVHGAATQPDDRDFVLPPRTTHESVVAYLERLARATTLVRGHPSIE